jgi:hypothetical protein
MPTIIAVAFMLLMSGQPESNELVSMFRFTDFCETGLR